MIENIISLLRAILAYENGRSRGALARAVARGLPVDLGRRRASA